MNKVIRHMNDDFLNYIIDEVVSTTANCTEKLMVFGLKLKHTERKPRRNTCQDIFTPVLECSGHLTPGKDILLCYDFIVHDKNVNITLGPTKPTEPPTPVVSNNSTVVIVSVAVVLLAVFSIVAVIVWNRKALGPFVVNKTHDLLW